VVRGNGKTGDQIREGERESDTIQEGVEDIQMNLLTRKRHIKNHRRKNDRETYLATMQGAYGHEIRQNMLMRRHSGC